MTSPPSHPQARIWSFGGHRPQTFCAYPEVLLQSACSYAVSKPESTFLTPHYFCSVLGPLIQKASEDPRSWLGTEASIKPTNFAVVWDAAHRRIWLFTELLLAYAAGLYLPPPLLISLKFPSPTFHPVSYMLLVYPASQRSFE